MRAIGSTLAKTALAPRQAVRQLRCSHTTLTRNHYFNPRCFTATTAPAPTPVLSAASDLGHRRKVVYATLREASANKITTGWGEKMLDACKTAEVKLTADDRKVVDEIDLKQESMEQWKENSTSVATYLMMFSVLGLWPCGVLMDMWIYAILFPVASFAFALAVVTFDGIKNITYDAKYLNERRNVLRKSLREKYGMEE